ncbi:MAG: Maf family protein [candidate division WOR-3 bacterium]
MSNYPIYLASKSPRRRTLLKQLDIKFKTLVPKIDEDISEKNPRLFAIKIARKKVFSVENKVTRGIIIGVDTIVAIDQKILGKPKNKKDAQRILKLLSGKIHKVISGICILIKPYNYIIVDYEESKVKFRKLSATEIENYLNTKEPYDKAGAYAIQGKAKIFVESIDGCYLNVIGLPVPKLIKHLKSLQKLSIKKNRVIHLSFKTSNLEK